MFREIILPIFRSTRLCATACGIMKSSAPEEEQNNCPKHVELTGIINKSLLLRIVGCLYYLYQWCSVKQISDNEIYLLIKYIKMVLWREVKRLSYIQDARCLMVKSLYNDHLDTHYLYFTVRPVLYVRGLLAHHQELELYWCSIWYRTLSVAVRCTCAPDGHWLRRQYQMLHQYNSSSWWSTYNARKM